MNLEAQILNALQQAPSPLLAPASCTLEPLQERVYRLRGGAQDLFVKWIADDDFYGVNELQVNRWLLTQNYIAVPRLLFTRRQGAATVACWEWLAGSDLRTNHRDRLPAAFAALGHFHRTQQTAGPLYSPNTRQTYPTIATLLTAELDFLCGFYSAQCHEAIMHQCRTMFSSLEAGYSTCIHGDMHPGNLRLTDRGLFFVDWGYARHTLNFFDLDYIQSIPFPAVEPSPWWLMTPAEAPNLLSAYFQACGLHHLDYQRVQLAVMAWNELRSHYHGIQHGQVDEEGSRQMLACLYQTYCQSRE